jgi:chromosome segregation ATPase
MDAKKIESAIVELSKETKQNTKGIKLLDGRMDKLEGRMDKLDGRMDKLEKTTNNLSIEVLKQNDKIENMVTKKEFSEFKNETMTRFDQMMVILNRLDQERYFSFEKVKRLENEVEKNTKEIREIKTVLNIK